MMEAINDAQEGAHVIEDFRNIRSLRDLARLLDVPLGHLTFLIHAQPRTERYRIFHLKKRNGGTRKIEVPCPPLKVVQRRLATLLNAVYTPRDCVYGYVPGRSISDNAAVHAGQRLILNIDLKDFFPSIHFGRVFGLFRSSYFGLPDDVARGIANLVCFDRRLPHGAPTSPVISNLICWRLDVELQKLATRCRCRFSRYADDITFSTSNQSFSQILVKEAELDRIVLSHWLTHLIRKNGFEINSEKTRLQSRAQRQMVTGLVVNSGVNVPRKYVRQIRTMLYMWKKHGQGAVDAFFERYDSRNRRYKPRFEDLVLGKIGFLEQIVGASNNNVVRFKEKYRELAPSYLRPSDKDVPEQPLIVNQTIGEILFEGKSDPIHVNCALGYLKRQFPSLYQSVEIGVPKGRGGDSDLFTHLDVIHRHRNDYPRIFIFDRDTRYRDKVEVKGRPKAWGNSVFSMLLPLPSHRSDADEWLSIEHLYVNHEIFLEDKEGRRLYYANEFDNITGRHLSDPSIICSHSKRNHRVPTIIDEKVFQKVDDVEVNVALSKVRFAENIRDRVSPFDSIRFDGFFPLLRMIEELLRDPESALSKEEGEA